MKNDPLIQRINERQKVVGLSDRRISLIASNDKNGDLVRTIRRGGSQNPRGDTLQGLARALECTPHWLLTGEGHPEINDPFPEPSSVAIADQRPPDRRNMPRDLPVLGAAAGARSETDGAIVMDGGPVEYLRRPPALQGVANAYVVYVVNDSMEPAFPHGEAACVNPNRPAKPGDNVIIQVRGNDGETYAYVKTLVKRTADAVICRQLNPPKELSFPRETVIAVHRVLTVTDLISY